MAPFELSRRDGTTTLRWRAHRGRVAGNGAFALISSAILALFFSRISDAFDTKDWVIFCALALGTVASWYSVLAGTLNQVTLDFDSRRLRVTQGPLPWRPVELPTPDLTGFKVRAIPRGLFYRVEAVTTDAYWTTVATGLSEQDATRLAASLNAELSQR